MADDGGYESDTGPRDIPTVANFERDEPVEAVIGSQWLEGIARIFNANRRRVTKAVKNSYAVPDDVGDDYDWVDEEFKQRFPPSTIVVKRIQQVIGELSEGNDIEGSNQFVVHVDQLHSDTQADSFRGGADRLDNGDISASMLHGAPAAEPRVKSKGKFNKGKGKSLKGSNQTVRGANFQGRARQFTGHAQPHHDDSGAMIYGGAEQIYTPNTNAHASSSAISPATPTNALNADPAIAPLEAFLASINLTHHLRLFVAHRFTDIEVLRAVGKWWSDEVLRDFLRQALTGRREDLGGEAGLSVEEFGVVERAIRTLKHSEEAG